MNFFINFNLFIFLSVILFPLLSIAITLVFFEHSLKYNIVLGCSLISFILSVLLWFVTPFDEPWVAGVPLDYSVYLLPSFSVSLRLGVDGISLFFIVLTNLFIYLCILSLNLQTVKLVEMLIYLFFIQWSVICSFLFSFLLSSLLCVTVDFHVGQRWRYFLYILSGFQSIILIF
jgi:NADH:ubiquinone oxidoreductase subunit 4 (subunit M)